MWGAGTDCGLLDGASLGGLSGVLTYGSGGNLLLDCLVFLWRLDFVAVVVLFVLILWKTCDVVE